MKVGKFRVGHKSKGKKACWHCHKRVILEKKKNCLERRENQNGFLNTDFVNVSDKYKSGEVLTVRTAQVDDSWIMDLACTYHMTPRKEILFNF